MPGTSYKEAIMDAVLDVVSGERAELAAATGYRLRAELQDRGFSAHTQVVAGSNGRRVEVWMDPPGAQAA